jgi:hypothetical protein
VFIHLLLTFPLLRALYLKKECLVTDAAAGTFGGVAIVASVGWIVWSIAYNFRRGWVAKKQMEVHLRLLERLGTGPDAVAYLQSPQGQQLLDAVSVERGTLVAKIMGSVQAGLILFLLGLSLFLVRAFVIDSSSLLIVGVSAMAIGAGFLLSSAFSFRLSRSLGLINDRQVGR